MGGGKDVETIQEAPAKLKGIFEDPAWGQHVLQRIQTANMSATNNNSTDLRKHMPGQPLVAREQLKLRMQTQLRCQCSLISDASAAALSLLLSCQLGQQSGIIGSC